MKDSRAAGLTTAVTQRQVGWRGRGLDMRDQLEEGEWDVRRALGQMNGIEHAPRLLLASQVSNMVTSTIHSDSPTSSPSHGWGAGWRWGRREKIWKHEIQGDVVYYIMAFIY